MKKALFFLMALAVVFGAYGGGSRDSGAAGKSITMTLATHLPETMVQPKSFHLFAADLKEKTSGRITMNVSAAGALGSQREIVEGVNLGTIQIGMGESGLYSNYVPAFGILSLPFFYKSEKHYFAVMDGDVGKKLSELLAAKTNLVVINWLYAGLRNVYASKPMKSLDSLKGLKIRTPESNVFVGGFKALGANPTPIAATEMYTALQQGVVEAMEGHSETAFSYKIYEVAKNCLETGHIYNDVSLVMNKQTLAGLPEDLRKILLDCAKTNAATERKMVQDTLGSFKDKLIKEGVVYAGIDLAKAAAAVADFHKSYTGNDPVMKELYEKIKAMPE